MSCLPPTSGETDQGTLPMEKTEVEEQRAELWPQVLAAVSSEYTQTPPRVQGNTRGEARSGQISSA